MYNYKFFTSFMHKKPKKSLHMEKNDYNKEGAEQSAVFPESNRKNNKADDNGNSHL